MTVRESVNRTTLRAHLEYILPFHMIPSHFVILNEWPLTPSGKIDRQQLPAPENYETLVTDIFEPPVTEQELQLAAIWQDVLGCEIISLHDNFFDRGGNSLKATRLLLKINKAFRTDLSLKDIFIKPVMKHQLMLIDQSQKLFDEIPVAEPADSYPLSSSQQRIYIASQFDMANIAYNMAGVYVLEGNLCYDALTYAFSALIERHQILRTSFHEDEMGRVRQYISQSVETDRRLFMLDLRETKDAETRLEYLLKRIYQNHSTCQMALYCVCRCIVSWTKSGFFAIVCIISLVMPGL